MYWWISPSEGKPRTATLWTAGAHIGTSGSVFALWVTALCGVRLLRITKKLVVGRQRLVVPAKSTSGAVPSVDHEGQRQRQPPTNFPSSSYCRIINRIHNNYKRMSKDGTLLGVRGKTVGLGMRVARSPHRRAKEPETGLQTILHAQKSYSHLIVPHASVVESRRSMTSSRNCPFRVTPFDRRRVACR